MSMELKKTLRGVYMMDVEYKWWGEKNEWIFWIKYRFTQGCSFTRKVKHEWEENGERNESEMREVEGKRLNKYKIQMMHIIDKFGRLWSEMSLKIDVQKSKVLADMKDQGANIEVKVLGRNWKEVIKLKYLRVMINADRE